MQTNIFPGKTFVLRKEKLSNFSNWISQCRRWIKNFPPNGENSYSHKEFIDPYLFIDVLSKQLGNNYNIVVDGGAFETSVPINPFPPIIYETLFSSLN